MPPGVTHGVVIATTAENHRGQAVVKM